MNTEYDKTTDPAQAAADWLAGKSNLKSGADLAATFELLAAKLRTVGALPNTILRLNIHVCDITADAVQREAVDQIATAFGLTAKQGTHYFAENGYAGNLHVVTTAKPPIPDQRTALLEQLAKLDAELKALPAESADYGFHPTQPPADLPPYVTVEVIEQGRDWTRLSVPSVDIGLTATCYVDNGSPAWLAEVPLGKRVVVRLAYEQIGRRPVRAFTDWVEPADDHCSPRLTDGGSWGIGTGDVCPLYYSDSPAEAVAAHNADLARRMPKEPADLGPVPAPAAPVAVSPERLAEILCALNIESGTDEAAFATGLDEYDAGSQRWDGEWFFSFALVDGTVISRPIDEDSASGWSVTR